MVWPLARKYSSSVKPASDPNSSSATLIQPNPSLSRHGVGVLLNPLLSDQFYGCPSCWDAFFEGGGCEIRCQSPKATRTRPSEELRIDRGEGVGVGPPLPIPVAAASESRVAAGLLSGTGQAPEPVPPGRKLKASAPDLLIKLVTRPGGGKGPDPAP
eukprot:749192-Hanusia_phi.AAC.2